MKTDVLVAGAGPTGLVLALWLIKQGVKVRLIDKTAEPGTTSRAVAVQARTLELYRQLDLTDRVLAAGHRVPGINLWVQGRAQARVPFDDFAADLTPYGPFIFPQDAHERLLIERLTELGGAVERQTELLGYSDEGDRIVARLRNAQGEEERCEAAYIAGCDGAHSLVRQTTGTGFPGGTYQQVFYVADIEGVGPALDGELHVDLDQADFLAVFPLDANGRARLIGTVRDERTQRPEALTLEDVSDQAIRQMKVEIRKVNWFSTYRVHHRVTDHFRKGRAFLLGDAAHIHSPAGGQGMNTGILDAINLAWKLQHVLAGKAPDSLLDSYEAERRAFALKLVASTDRGFTLATAEGSLASFVRTRIVPLAVPLIFRIEAMREFLFRTVSQIAISYRDKALASGVAGAIHGGDRLPWAAVAGHDNFEPLKAIVWQVHVYGTASPALAGACRARGLPLHVFDWHERHGKAGLARDALYLVRPDGYVGLADAAADPASIARYFSERGLS